MRRLLLVLVLIGAALALPHAQSGSVRIGVRLHNPDSGPPPDPEDPGQSISISTPAQNLVTTTESEVTILGSFTNLIKTVTWANSLTMDEEDAVVNLLTGTFVTQGVAVSTKFQDAFTRASNANLSAHTPTLADGSAGTGTGWTALRSDGAKYCEGRSSDYVQPSAADAGGTAVVICEAIPAVAISGTNYDVSLQLALGQWTVSTTANTALMFSIVDVTAATEDYCFLELFTSSLNPDVRLVKVVAGTPTVLDSDNFAPINGQVWKVTRRGNDIVAYQDGVARLTATDAACATSTRTGIGFGAVYPGGTRVISTSARVDNFLLEDPDAGATGITLDVGTNDITVEGCEEGGMPCYQATVRFIRTAGADDVFPTGTVSSPTSQLTYATSDSAISWAGTAADNVGVASVVVGCAECTPTSRTATLVGGTWSTASFVMATGPNNFIVTITDTNTNATVLPTRVVTLSASADTTIPTVTITGPESDGGSTHTTPSVTLAGTATDLVALATVNTIAYSSDTCGSGTLSIGGGGTSISWSVNLTLTATCAVSVTSRDAAGNISTADTHTFTYTPALSINQPYTLPLAIQNVAYPGASISSSGGSGAKTWDNGAGGSSLGGGACTGGSVTDAGETASVTGTFTTTGTCTTNIRVCDTVVTCVTQSFTIPVSTGTLGGQNNALFDSMCARAAYPAGDRETCVSLRSTASLSSVGGGTYTNTFSGEKTWKYDPANDLDPERQDAAKFRMHGWVGFGGGKTVVGAMDAPAAGTIQILTFSPNMGSQSNGRAIRIDNEILTCVHPTNGADCRISGANGTQGYYMRGAYGSTVATHLSGTQVYTIVAGNTEHLHLPVSGSTTTSETRFASLDVYFADEWGDLAVPATCSGLPGGPWDSSAFCAQQHGGAKAWQWRSNASITWETKVTVSAFQPSTLPSGLNNVSGGDIGGIVFRNYTTVGPPHQGADYVRPMAYQNFIYRPSTWIRLQWLMETNHDQNTAAFTRLTDLTAPLLADAADTTISLDYTSLPPALPVGDTAFSNYHIVSSTNAQRGRRVRIDSEIMSIESCAVYSNPQPTTRQCTVVRQVDGSTLATHSAGADVELIWDYFSLWASDETHGPQLIFDRIPVTRRRNTTTGAATPVGVLEWEFDDSQSRVISARAARNFVDFVMYAKNFVTLKKAGTGGAGGGTLPAEWASFITQPTTDGN